ncbi:MAG: hypothetical protein ACLQU4_09825 [Limisphaerales bacterium]
MNMDDFQLKCELLELKNRHRIRLMICKFLIFALGFSIVCCFLLIFLFLATGHELSESFLQRLCGVTIAQAAVLLAVFVRSVWRLNIGKKPEKSDE